MKPQLSIEVVWQDDDIVELEVMAANEAFSGSSRVYTTYEDLDALAHQLAGFPSSGSEELCFLAGKKGSSFFFCARFYCFDAAGHAAARLSLEGNVGTEFRADEKDSVELELQFEALGSDAFVSELRSLVQNRSGQACLAGIRRHTQNVLRET